MTELQKKIAYVIAEKTDGHDRDGLAIEAKRIHHLAQIMLSSDPALQLQNYYLAPWCIGVEAERAREFFESDVTIDHIIERRGN